MRYLLTQVLLVFSTILFSQDIIYLDRFDNDILSVGANPNGYTMSLEDGDFRIAGNGNAGEWTAMSYNMHDGNGTQINIDISSSPKIYIKAKGENQPSVRIDFQDETGYVTNQNPVEVRLDNNYNIYEYDLTGRLNDGAYGGPCTSAPCPLDPSAIRSLIIFINAPNGGYSGNVDIDWISIGAPFEDFDSGGSSSIDIRYNQVTYLVGREKLISIASNEAFSDVPFAIFKGEEANPILEGQVSSDNRWEPSREYVGTIDVSSLNEEGSYILKAMNETVQFFVSADGYREICEASLKYYYFNRASQALTSEYAGQWERPLGHPDDKVIVHPSAASTSRPSGTIIASPKGWYDAGDYNKYIVNSGISTYTLLAAYEHYPEYYGKLEINIPEKGGDLPDILDEIKWNLDWMLTMQDPSDGGVYHKLTGLNFSGIVMPHQYNFDRYVVQKTTAAALNLAAVTAVAARIYREFEEVLPGYSDELLAASEQAYTWAKANPKVYYNQPNNVSTGQYGDNNVKDEFDWAAAELLITTLDTKYSNDINESSIGSGVPAWPYTAPLALISLAHHQDALGSIINSTIIRNKILSTADDLIAKLQQSSMHVAMGSEDFFWGSNGHAGNQVVMLIRAYELSNNEEYLDAAFMAIDYLLGRNGTGFCYVSGFGNKSPRKPHHRVSEADNVSDPVPGMVAGGPNPGQQDNCSGYPNNYPASSYVDSWCSYASNEVTINWNAPLAYAVNALQFYQVGISSSVKDIKPLSLELFPNPGGNSLHIKVEDFNLKSKVEIFNLTGSRVLVREEWNGERIDVTNLDTGIYIIKYAHEGKIKTAKWIKI